MKKLICLLMSLLLLAGIAACQKTQPTDATPANTSPPAETPTETQAANTMTAYRADGSAVVLEDCGDGTWKDADGPLYYLGEDGVLRARGAEDLYTVKPSDTGANPADAAEEDADYYSFVTAMGKSEVEALAAKIRKAYLDGDWAAISTMIRYPITMYPDVEIRDEAAFLSYMDGKKADESAIEAMEQETCTDMFFNGDDGICLGSGQVWLYDMHYMEDAEPLLQIIALNGIVETSQSADDAAGTPPYADASAPRITKSPTGETVNAGDSALFVAKSEDATRAVWHFVSPDLTRDLEYTEAAQEFSGLDIIDADTGSLALRNIPESLNGWSVYCRFSNAIGSSDTDRATITVNAAKAPEQGSFDYTGTFTEARAQRGTMTITGSPSLYEVSVDWYEGSTEYITTFSGMFSDTGILSYSNACLTVRFEDGSFELRYTGGTGSLSYVDSGVVGVYWTDDQSEYDEDNFFFAKD